MDPGMIFVIVLVVVVGALRTTRPLVHALADAIRNWTERGHLPQARDDQLEALRETVESLNNEVARLSERVEFTERLLEKPRKERVEAPVEVKDPS